MDPLTSYTITISGAALTEDGTPLDNDATVTFTTGAYFATGLGLYRIEQYGQEYEGETMVDSWETGYWVSRAPLDDRWDILR